MSTNGQPEWPFLAPGTYVAIVGGPWRRRRSGLPDGGPRGGYQPLGGQLRDRSLDCSRHVMPAGRPGARPVQASLAMATVPVCMTRRSLPGPVPPAPLARGSGPSCHGLPGGIHRRTQADDRQPASSRELVAGPPDTVMQAALGGARIGVEAKPHPSRAGRWQRSLPSRRPRRRRRRPPRVDLAGLPSPLRPTTAAPPPCTVPGAGVGRGSRE
eukprot:scaffold326_cov376-Prasinococcus_capsulatus_cf.AAC.1